MVIDEKEVEMRITHATIPIILSHSSMFFFILITAFVHSTFHDYEINFIKICEFNYSYTLLDEN